MVSGTMNCSLDEVGNFNSIKVVTGHYGSSIQADYTSSGDQAGSALSRATGPLLSVKRESPMSSAHRIGSMLAVGVARTRRVQILGRAVTVRTGRRFAGSHACQAAQRLGGSGLEGNRPLGTCLNRTHGTGATGVNMRRPRGRRNHRRSAAVGQAPGRWSYFNIPPSRCRQRVGPCGRPGARRGRVS